MQSPLAARIDQPIADQRLQDVLPAGSFPRIRQPTRPEPIQLELLIQMTRQPTRAPLPRPMQLHCLQPHLYAIALGMLGNRAIGGEQSQLRVSSSPFIKAFEHPTPSLVLAIVDLSPSQHLALPQLAATTPPALCS